MKHQELTAIVIKPQNQDVKTYKDGTYFIAGMTDIGSLLLRGCNEKPLEISVAWDGIHYGYHVAGIDVEIPAHYEKIYEAHDWLKIYDDGSCSADIKGENITVYQASGTLLIVNN